MRKLILKIICFTLCFTFFFTLTHAASTYYNSIDASNLYLFPLILLTLFVFFILITFLIRKLFIEKQKNRELKIITENSTNTISSHIGQVEALAQSLFSILSDEDEEKVYDNICKTIINYSDYQRLLISLFRDEYPHRVVLGYGGLSKDEVEKITTMSLSKGYFESICNFGIQYGQLCHYIPNHMKHIFQRNTVLYGTGPTPKNENNWHPEDNLLVKILDRDKNLIGIISLDTSKSKQQPNDEIVRPLELLSSLLSLYLERKNSQTKLTELSEQLRQVYKMEAIGHVTSGIAHDFNNILGRIIGNTDLALTSTQPDFSTQLNLQEIKKAGEKARELVQQFLSFSKKSDSNLQPINILAPLEEAILFIRSTIPSSTEVHHNIQVSEAMVVADPNQLYQVLLNLCSNSTQAMDEMGGVLTITITKREITANSTGIPINIENGAFLTITISDTGTGIDQEIIHRIFDPGFTTNTTGEKTGMGLKVAKDIVENHGGVITVSTVIAGGSEFTIYLPLYDDDEEKEIAKHFSTLQQGEENIMFVDDDPSLLSLGQTMLTKLGYDVTIMNNPIEALELIKNKPHNYDLVITDMTMPQMSGDRLCKEILQINSNIKIILCTGYSDKINKEEALRIGVAGYYEKPLSMQTFSNAVRQILDQQ